MIIGCKLDDGKLGGELDGAGELTLTIANTASSSSGQVCAGPNSSFPVPR